MANKKNQYQPPIKKPVQQPRAPQEVIEIERELREANPDIFSGVPSGKVTEITSAIMYKLHSGPLPDPQTLNHYNQVIPDGADRIMKMAEQQSAHRMQMENQAVSAQLKQSGKGQNFALTIGLTALIIAGACVMMDKGWPGTVIGVGGITGLVSAFLVSNSQKAKNLKDKAAKA